MAEKNYYVLVEDADGRTIGVWFFENENEANDFCNMIDDYANKNEIELYYGDGPQIVGDVTTAKEAFEELKDSLSEDE
jgi:hypothetical protein